MQGLPWHALVLERLERSLDKDQVPHALALTCGEGWGHLALLNAACSLLLGISPGEESTLNLAEVAHPDMRWVVPDGAVIKVEQIRRLNEFAVQTPQIAERKVAAIVDAHLLNANAANALLKTLEEPPPNTHIVIATTRWGRLLPTIRSRCQRLQHDQSSAVAHAWLVEQGISISDHEFAELGYAPLAAAAPGPLRLVDWLTRLSDDELPELVNALDGIDLVAWLAQWYRAIIPMLLVHKSPREWFGFCDELIEIRRQIETSNAANSRLLLERLITLWRKLQVS